MDPTAAKYIGAGIACIGMGGAGVGVGIIFGNYLAAALRNPSAAQGQFGNLIFGFAITEALGIFSLLIALLAAVRALTFGWPSRPPIPKRPRDTTRFPPFQAQHFPSQLFWLALTFILLYVLMSRIALPRIGSIFAERSKRIADDLAAAQRFKEQSDAANAAYQKSLADARARAQGIANETRERQAAEAEATNKRLEAQLHEKLAAAERSIAATRTGGHGAMSAASRRRLRPRSSNA